MAAHHRSAHMDLFKESASSLVEWPPQIELLIPEARRHSHRRDRFRGTFFSTSGTVPLYTDVTSARVSGGLGS
jgi:hypothetical protein